MHRRAASTTATTPAEPAPQAPAPARSGYASATASSTPAAPTAAAVPARLAYTGAEPWLVIAGGALLMTLGVLALGPRRSRRAR